MQRFVSQGDYQKLAVLLVKGRLDAGMTQADVAVILGKPQSFVSKYERGERRIDFIETVRLCEVLRISPLVLVAMFSRKDGILSVEADSGN